MLTPGKNRATHNMQGTIYSRLVDSVDSNIIYHCHAAMTREAIETNPVWTIWRENLTTGVLTNPVDSVTGDPKPTADPFTAISNSSGDPITNSNNDPIFT